MSETEAHDPKSSDHKAEDENHLATRSDTSSRRSRSRSKTDIRKSHVSRIILSNTESFVIEPQDPAPLPRRSMAELRRMSHNPAGTVSIQERIRRKSAAWLQNQNEEKGEDNSDDDHNKLIDIAADMQDATTDIYPSSILSKTYKDVTKHVFIRDELTGEDVYWGREYLGEDEELYGEGGGYYRQGAGGILHTHRGTFGGDLLASASVRRGQSFAASASALRELLHERVGEVYRKMEIRTFGQLLEAKAVRPKRLDAYCLGRGILEKPVPVMMPVNRPKPKMKEETIEDVETFFRRIAEIEEENVNDEQIVCVFTGTIVRSKKTWNEDCNMIEAALNIIKNCLAPTGYLLWVRTGYHKDWKDPTNPFKTDKRLMIRWLPTIKVWNTEKRAAGNRLFFLDHITVLLED